MTVVNISEVDVWGVYREFLRVQALSVGVYKHGVGVDVPQEPHTEDEVYYVVDGDGTISIDGVDHAVRTGSVVYVPALVRHHFHSVTRDLLVLVFFSPAEDSGAARNC
jgi:mannose-6-phosphate isomerase-like protein (cupin superfamily)